MPNTLFRVRGKTWLEGRQKLMDALVTSLLLPSILIGFWLPCPTFLFAAPPTRRPRPPLLPTLPGLPSPAHPGEDLSLSLQPSKPYLLLPSHCPWLTSEQQRLYLSSDVLLSMASS